MSILWRLQLGLARFTPSADLRRKLGNGLAFAAGGLVACASAVALIVPPLDAAPHYVPPSSAFVLAPAPSQLRPTNAPAVAAVLPVVDTAPTAKFMKADSRKSCPRDATGADVACESGVAQKPNAVAAAPNPPAAPENPVTANDKPAAEPAAVVASAPAAEDPNAAEPAPPAVKPRKKVRRQRDREFIVRDSAFWSYGYHRGSGQSRQNSWSGLFR